MTALNKIKENIFAQIFIIYTRLLTRGALVFASLIKIKGNRFTTLSGADEPINTAWHFLKLCISLDCIGNLLGWVS